MMEQQWSLLRELLGTTPSSKGWEAIIAFFSQQPQERSFEEELTYAKMHLQSWPSSLRRVVHVDAPAWHWELAEHLDLGWQGLRRAFSYKDLLEAHGDRLLKLRWLTLSGHDDLQGLLSGPRLELEGLTLTNYDFEEDEDALGPLVERYGAELSELFLLNCPTLLRYDFRKFTSLRGLSLLGASLWDTFSFAFPTSLERLDVGAIASSLPFIEALEQNLSCLGSLREVTLSSMAISSVELLAVLSKLPALQRLCFYHCDVKPAVIDEIASSGFAASLESLSFVCCGISEKSLKKLPAQVTASAFCGWPSLVHCLSGSYLKEYGNAFDGEYLVLKFFGGEDGPIKYSFHWSGFWSSEYAADSDFLKAEGMVHPLSHNLVLLIPETEDGHIYDAFEKSWPYLVFLADGSCQILSDQPPPNHNYEGPFYGLLLRQS